jgi:LytS/YehU family sensor histidine kinase
MAIYGDIANPATFLCMTTTAACMSISTLAKRWFIKQQEWMQAEQEKMMAQLQVLKAQLHPHFLFNTLNNIYAYAFEGSTNTPRMVLRLSSLLSYMLYDCNEDEVLLEKEIEVIRNYIDLEKERYGEKLDISINIEGDIIDHYIAPLLILPFLENAFKHGTSEQLGHPWMSVDIMVKNNRLMYKVVNSKNEDVPHRDQGVGICNIRRRLELLYPGRHELKLTDEGVFFVASLIVELKGPITHQIVKKKFSYSPQTSKKHEDSLSAH